jgi:hypothetical protein
MAKFAPIASLAMMKSLDEKDLLGDYHLLLAHKILEDPQGWGSFFQRRLTERGEDFIIMDNSLIELGRPLSVQEVVNAAVHVAADCIVLPDKLTDMSQTFEMSKAAMQEYTAVCRDWFDFLGVVQGKTEDEYMKCAEGLVGLGCHYLSIPRVTKEVLGSRVFITERIISEFGKDIHLLGFSDDLIDDLATANMFSKRESFPVGVIGIDSSEPLRMGCAFKRINTFPRVCPRRPEDWLDKDWPITNEVEYNLHWVRRVIA